MELAANIWPVVDPVTGQVKRFFARAYAVEGTDDEIVAVLKSLAPTDYAAARAFPIPALAQIALERGSTSAPVSAATFQKHESAIVDGALKELERDAHAKFLPNPCLLITTLLDMPDGLIPQLP